MLPLRFEPTTQSSFVLLVWRSNHSATRGPYYFRRIIFVKIVYDVSFIHFSQQFNEKLFNWYN